VDLQRLRQPVRAHPPPRPPAGRRRLSGDAAWRVGAAGGGRDVPVAGWPRHRVLWLLGR
jgi:hypothetical protein